MMPPLNEIVGLPASMSSAEIAVAAEQCCQTLFAKASGGDVVARRELVKLHAAYLTWAYADWEHQRKAGKS